MRVLTASLASIARRLSGVSLPKVMATGLAIRFLLAPFSSDTHDVYPFYRVTADMMGGLDPYASSFYTYPPLWAYVLFPLFALLGVFVDPRDFAEFVPMILGSAETTGIITPTVTAPLFNLVLKLPLIGADLGIAVILHRWVSASFGQGQGKSAAILWFLNPLVITATAVQGQFDILPAFFTLVGCFFLIRRQPFFGGLALGVAILFKIYPIFLLAPLLFLIIALQERNELVSKSGIAKLLRPTVLFLSGTATVLAVLGLPLLWTRFVEVALVRRAQFPVVGGFTPLFPTMLDVWPPSTFGQAFLEWITRIASPLLLLIPFSISLILGLSIVRRARTARRVRTEDALGLATIPSLVALYSVLPAVNYQHLLWILPFLVLISARSRRLRWLTLIVSLAGVLFFFSLMGVAAFLFPLGNFTPVIGVDALNRQVIQYWSIPGLISTRLRLDLLFATAAFGYIALLLAAIRVVRHWRKQAAYDEVIPGVSPSRQPSESQASRLPKITALTLVFFLLIQGIVLLPGIPPSGALQSAQYNLSENILTVDVRGHALYGSLYGMSVTGLKYEVQIRSIFLYYDDAYPVLFTPRAAIIGIYDHLRSELALTDLEAEFRLVDASSLVDVLTGPPAILIVATTALPEVIFSPRQVLMKEWIEGGGVLIWAGGLLGVYVGSADGEVYDMTEDEGEGDWGPQAIIGYDPILEVGEPNATFSSRWGEALDIRFPTTQWGANVDEVQNRSGIVAGLISVGDNPKSSLSILPVGNGSVAYFGGPVRDVFTYNAEDILARDIVRLILSGLLFNPTEGDAVLLASSRVYLQPNTKRRLALTLQPPESSNLLQVVVFSRVQHDTGLFARSLPL